MAERGWKRDGSTPALPVAGRESSTASSDLLDYASPRAVFADLMAAALQTLRASPSPLAVSYLIGLLDLQLRSPDPDPPRLADVLLTAISEDECGQTSRLRDVGDRALFVSGFFGESLHRCVVGLDYYTEVGRMAYDRLSTQFANSGDDRGWRELFRELADDFGAFVELLAEVAGRSRPHAPFDLLEVYARYVETGSRRDQSLLIRNGLIPLPADSLRRWQ